MNAHCILKEIEESDSFWYYIIEEPLKYDDWQAKRENRRYCEGCYQKKEGLVDKKTKLEWL